MPTPPKTEAEWRAQPGPWAHLTQEQTNDLINTMVAREREACAALAEGMETASGSLIARMIRARSNSA